MSLSLHAPSISRPRTTVVAMSLAWPISLMVSWWAGKGSQKTAQKNVGKKGFPCSTYPRGSVGLVYLPTCTMKNQPNVGKYTSPMDPLGNNPRWFQWILRNLFAHFEQWKAPPRNGINRGQKMATEQRFGHFRWREYSLLMVGKKTVLSIWVPVYVQGQCSVFGVPLWLANKIIPSWKQSISIWWCYQSWYLLSHRNVFQGGVCISSWMSAKDACKPWELTWHLNHWEFKIELLFANAGAFATKLLVSGRVRSKSKVGPIRNVPHLRDHPSTYVSG